MTAGAPGAAAAVEAVRWPGVIEAYRDRMPVEAGWKIVTLGEGGTPLLPAPHLSERTGCEVFLKVDGANPTGSFKDRGMTMAVTDALAGGKQGVICASTGNTSASAAAYAARAGMTCAVLVPAGQDRARQARPGRRARRADPADRRQLRRLPGAGPQDRGRLPGRRAGQLGQPDPDRRPGQRRLRDLRRARPRPGRALPAGRQRRQHHRLLGGLPRLPGRRADHRRAADVRLPGRRAAPLVHGAPVRNPETIATAIRIGAPASWAAAMTARDESDGRFAAVTDDEILAAYRLLSAREAVFVEPASAASVAGLLQSAADGTLPRGLAGGVHGHRARAEGPRHRAARRAGADRRPDRPRRRRRRAGAAR